MNILVIYTSTYGNTRKIADAVREGCGPDARLVKFDALTAEMLRGVDVAFVGSPTIAWKYAPGFERVFDAFEEANEKMNESTKFETAAFDTGLAKWYAGDGAGRIAKKLKHAGCRVVGKPTRFFVLGKEGPLKEGEIERAKAWARDVCSSLSK